MEWKGRWCAQEDTFGEQNILTKLGSKTNSEKEYGTQTIVRKFTKKTGDDQR